MINRKNWLDVQEYLDYHENVLLHSKKTIARKRSLLRHLLEWADEIPFPDAHTIRPVFPVYLLTARNDGKDIPLSRQGMKRICAEGRMFYKWAIQAKRERYKSISEIWIATLRPARAYRTQSGIEEIKFYTPEEVIAVCSLPPERLIDRRNQAAAAFLFLSGMRINAFVSLPIHCVDLETMSIQQLPDKGVRTKNHKAAITYLYQIPPLLEVVKEWDILVRSQLQAKSFWFPAMSTDGTRIRETNRSPDSRRQDFVRGLKRLCDRAGIRYRSPHAFRHGHGVFGVKNARTMEELKAVSQNMMHATLTTTDSMYGNLGGENIRRVILTLGQNPFPEGHGETPEITQAILERALNTLLTSPACGVRAEALR